MPEADAIVLDIDGGAMLQACIASLRAQRHNFRQIVIVDNGSVIPVAERLSGSDLRFIRNETNAGFAEGVNQAYRLLRSEALREFIALINNDVVLDPRWLERMLDAASDERIAAVQSWIVRDAKTLDGAGISIRDGVFRQIAHGQAPDSPIDPAWGVSATAALYRTSALRDTVFRASFFAYYEDVELNARLREQGFQIRVVPEPLATHEGSRTAPLLGRRSLYLRTRNRYWVARLHPDTAHIPSLLLEDLKLRLKHRSTLRGIAAGLFAPIP